MVQLNGKRVKIVLPEDPRPNMSLMSAFKQQSLPAWQPRLTAQTVLPSFFLLGFTFLAVGTGLLYTSQQVQEFTYDYTNCISREGKRSCAEEIAKNNGRPCKCLVFFDLDEDILASVYIYYGLTNYYQNHRIYEDSVDTGQLGGRLRASSSCEPFRYKPVDGQQRPIVPCGTIANSLFNDTFALWYQTRIGQFKVPLSHVGLSWETDKSRFKNPRGDLQEIYSEFTNPPYWGNRTIWQLDRDNQENNGLQNEGLIVWMRTSAFPSFRKFYARVDHKIHPIFATSLPRGAYLLEIDYNYPVVDFKGTKQLVISNTSWLGGKNNFLGIAYIVFGGLVNIGAAVLFYIYKKYGWKKLGMILISDNTPYLSEFARRAK